MCCVWCLSVFYFVNYLFIYCKKIGVELVMKGKGGIKKLFVLNWENYVVTNRTMEPLARL